MKQLYLIVITFHLYKFQEAYYQNSLMRVYLYLSVIDGLFLCSVKEDERT